MEKYMLVTNNDQLDQMIEILKAEPWVVFDLLTAGPNPEKDKILGWTFCSGENGTVYYIPVGPSDLLDTIQLRSDSVSNALLDFLKEKQLVGHDLFSKMAFVEQNGPKPVFFARSDVTVEAYLQGQYPDVEISTLIEYFKDNSETNRAPKDVISIQDTADHAWERAYYIRKIHLQLYPKIMESRDLRRLHKIEMGVLAVAAEMQKTGLRIDFDRCRSECSRLADEADRLNHSLHNWLARNFDITSHVDFASSPQTASLLVDKLKVVNEVKTAKGNRSTSKKAFEGIRASSPIVNGIFTYRELVRAASAFYGIYPKYEGGDGRIHPRLLTTHVISGRTASADPCVQQLPREMKWSAVDFDDPVSDQCATCTAGSCKDCQRVPKKTIASMARKVFLPRDGYTFVEADFSQIELVVLAGVAGETAMLQAFREGEDLHKKTASLIFGVPVEQVTSWQRQVAKTTNFRFLYGGGPNGLAAQLGIPIKDAYSINEAYSRAYKMINAFAASSGRNAAQNGYIETLFGRRRYMDDFVATDPKSRARGRRLSVNLQIQGGASDIAKIGLIRQDTARKKFDEGHGCTTYLCNFIHDSYLWEVPIISADGHKQIEFLKAFVNAMRDALCFDVGNMTGIEKFPTLRVDFKVGKNYHKMIAID